jgi:N-acylneuraminate cytidylyltransferase
MIDGNAVLGVILARGGSKGLERKNIRELAGSPLIAWTIESGLASAHLDRLVLSTDEAEIASVAREHGCDVPFVRPARLAEDDSTSMEALLHALDRVGEPYDYVVMLQPTSPLRTAGDIDATISACAEQGAPACVTVTETGKPPQWMYTLDRHRRLRPILDDHVPRRQEADDVFVLNGAVYVARISWLRTTETFLHPETIAHRMPRERSIDIDDALDLTIAEALIAVS